MPTATLLRPATDADVSRLVTLNNASIPAVPETPADDMVELLDASSLALVAVDPGTPADALGFVVALDGGEDWSGENYAWFEERGLDHLYVDRIVVGEQARGRGIGRLFYDAVFDAARTAGHDVVTCEVNLNPPNPGSLRFHGRLGFEERGQQLTKGGDILVAKLAADVSNAHAPASPAQLAVPA
ncbi:GNAT family N-acetyltransferase [Promicromonospora iranensis]|uniref:GNAT superfamily acetyltransferase n=1 Tax=Promicromonospora iranensis TaxID=1105144 RepID=A0ABU2CSM6_9MICO|nr:GNAT family N-acetyltransferase [Promicromonospora iranensis]MDR7384334.1 putative GNAT superfamily acetyltransferase [Promicromonospora iranensis]